MWECGGEVFHNARTWCADVSESAWKGTSFVDKIPRFRSLKSLFAAMDGCARCDLALGRTQVVHGDGSPKSGVMLIGEGPGQQEDKQGKPFVGSSGRYLDRLLEEAGLVRSEVYITNIVACRPPGNRAPKISEMKAHAPWIEEQLRLVKPRLIVTLGRSALIYFLPKAKITQVHGQVARVERESGVLHLLPTFHPAAVFRNE